MLSTKDLSINLRQIQFLSFLRIIPVTVKGGRLIVSKSYKRLYVFIFYMILVQSHVFHSVFIAVDKLNRGWREALPTMSLDFLFVVSIQMCVFIVFVNFILHCDEVCEIFNKCTTHESYLITTKSSLLPCLQLGFADLLAKFLPILANAFVIEFSVISAWTRTLPALSGTSPCVQVLAIGTEVLVTLCFTNWCYFAILLQILFNEKASNVLQRETQAARDAAIKAASNQRKLVTSRFSCAAIRTLQVEINMFNNCQANIVCAFRADFTGTVVLCGLTVMEFFYLHPIIGAFNGVCAVYSVFFYVSIYNSGFQLPRRCAAWKRLHLRQIGLLKCSGGDSLSLEILRRKLRSVCTRVVGVRVGDFHYLKRDSTPSFVDFNIKYIVRLMVAFRRR